MGKYTVTLNYLLKNNIPIWTFEDIVSTYYDDNFTAEKWASLKQLFETKYLYEEIGNETVELWNHYIMASFVERIHTYKQMLALYKQMESENHLKDNTNEVDTQVVNSILPYNSNGVLGNSSDIQNSTQKGGGRSVSAVDLAENFYRKYRDLDDEFIDGFRHNFMEVY